MNGGKDAPSKENIMDKSLNIGIYSKNCKSLSTTGIWMSSRGYWGKVNLDSGQLPSHGLTDLEMESV